MTVDGAAQTVEDQAVAWDEIDWDQLARDFIDEKNFDQVDGPPRDQAELARLLGIFLKAASAAVSPETRRQLESLLRDGLIVFRDLLDRAIEHLDGIDE